ncbi:FMN-dependent oxidoreductase, nitrilotriacetate monooxygenase family [Paenibacillus sp. 1_12]|uniref:LLM class flavin-dependent oxidoreductase n=1 Tax=Paenibacillus sp. 1_12 TaxID=1566278 RepID=UPI0008ECC545|nr:LLM class flavin-dependent oxidoreductase [Paenibacillus sp. 1_12]SFL21336.1 FMN-dependent oxidoreductase, nitrilotriacetate monooxygenase family [Paenibacillus sp. 1_12]
MTKTDRKAHFNVFIRGTGHHAASSKHPLVNPNGGLDLAHFANQARTAERGLLDSLFVADGYAGLSRGFEPFTLFSALATLTKHIGFIATVGTTYNDPYHVARQFASLDHISKGRAAWNIVTGAQSAAHNFGREEHPDVEQRYRVGEEFVDVVKQLWDSWEEDALVYNKEKDIRLDSSKVYNINFQGEYYKVKGPLNIPRPPQGYPVLVQAGSSEGGKELAARTAEAIFTAQQTLGAAQDFYSDVKGRLAKFGRKPDQLLILPGLCPIIGDTEAEARDLEEELFTLLNTENALRNLSRFFTVDLSEYPLDAPVPLDKLRPAEEFRVGITSRRDVIIDAAIRDKFTIKQFISRSAGGHGHITHTGSVLQIADFIEKWFREGGADGFNILPPIFPTGLDAFVDKVIPELQNRGIFRTAYEGRTLRENLGLARPDNQHKQIWAASGQTIEAQEAAR